MSTTERETQKEYDPEESGLYWREQINHAIEVSKTWNKRATEIVERYRDERMPMDLQRSKFNILWSNVQVLKPSLYGRKAKPEVSRRYMDADPVARLASTMLERVLDYECSQFPDFDSAMQQVVEDRLLPGRGQIWMRYEPVFGTAESPQITSREIQREFIRDANGRISEVQESGPDGYSRTRKVQRDEKGDITGVVDSSPPFTPPRSEDGDTIDSAHAPVDYVYWKDFLHSPARIWDETWWVARAVYMTADEGIERFGDVFKNVPLEEYREDNAKNPKGGGQKDEFKKKAKVWEIWNKRTSRVCWLAEGYALSLDERADPLGLEGFFPCPRPLFATTTNGSLIPVPDYVEYHDQARELDVITGRISMLVKAIKAVGVSNAEFKELSRMLSEGVDNKIFPVSNWGAFIEKGGINGAIELLDLTTQIQALGTLYKAREDIKQSIYEICGISDILRGSTKAEETLGAQQLKANFGSLRLKNSQQDVAQFAADIFRLKAQIICKFFPPELIIKISTIEQLPEGKDPQMVMSAIQMLSDAQIRDFHINVESDSLAQIDEDAEKQQANEAITAIGAFMKEALPVVAQAPEMLPMISETLLFLVRKYRVARSLEAAIEQSMKMLAQAAQQRAANPPPSKEQVEAQMSAQADAHRAQLDAQTAQMKAQQDAAVQQAKLQAESQLEQQKMQMDLQAEQAKAQIDLAKSEKEMQIEQMRMQMETAAKSEIADKDNATKIKIAEIQAATQLQVAEMGIVKAAATAAMKPDPVSGEAEPAEEPAAAPAKPDDGEILKGMMEKIEMLATAVKMIPGPSSGDAPFSLKSNSAERPEAPQPKQRPKSFKVMRDDKGKMSQVVPEYDDA